MVRRLLLFVSWFTTAGSRLLYSSWFTQSEKASSNAGVLSFWSISCLNRKFRAFGHVGCPTGPTSGWYPQGNGSSDIPSKDIHPCVGNESLFFETCSCMNVKTFRAVFLEAMINVQKSRRLPRKLRTMDMASYFANASSVEMNVSRLWSVFCLFPEHLHSMFSPLAATVCPE